MVYTAPLVRTLAHDLGRTIIDKVWCILTTPTCSPPSPLYTAFTPLLLPERSAVNNEDVAAAAAVRKDAAAAKKAAAAAKKAADVTGTEKAVGAAAAAKQTA